MITEILEEELDRNERAQQAYVAECDRLPKGSVAIKKRGKKSYCYLKYRKGNQIITDYIGTAEKVEKALRAQITRRKELEATIRQLKLEQRYIERILHHGK